MIYETIYPNNFQRTIDLSVINDDREMIMRPNFMRSKLQFFMRSKLG
jgi:hypothetical protein